MSKKLLKVFGILKPFLQKGFKPPEAKSINPKREAYQVNLNFLDSRRGPAYNP